MIMLEKKCVAAKTGVSDFYKAYILCLRKCNILMLSGGGTANILGKFML